MRGYQDLHLQSTPELRQIVLVSVKTDSGLNQRGFEGWLVLFVVLFFFSLSPSYFFAFWKKTKVKIKKQ